MIRFLVQRPIAIFMATLALLLLGMVAAGLIPTSLMPDIPIPEITVQVSYPANTARELETNVVRPLRNRLLQVSDLKDIHSATQDGFGTIRLQFEHGTNTDLAFIEVNEKVDASLNDLPRDLERPKVIKASATDIPVLHLTVSLRGDYSDERFLELSEFAESVIKKRIEQLPDIALADISGQAQAEIQVIPHLEKLQSLGIGATELADAIRQNNFELGNLSVRNGIYQYHFKFSNPLKSRRDLACLYLNLNGRLFQLKDLADVRLRPAQDRGLVDLNGKRAVVLAIIKQADARMYDLQEALQDLTRTLVAEYPDLDFATNQDQTQLLKLSIDNLKSSLWMGSMLAILIMFFFLQDLKSPLIIAVSIPVSLITSILFMYLMGLSINIISLSGLILGVGMMIDNAIIVIDNITQKLEEGHSLLSACTRGTNEIITPLLSSVLTTCSVFLPLLFLSGITGALFYDQAVAVSIGLLSSLLVSVLLIPVLFRLLKQQKFAIEKRLQLHLPAGMVEGWYERGYHFFFRHRVMVFGIAIFSTALAVYFFNTLPYRQLPALEQNEAVLQLDWNENITVDENRQRLCELLAPFPELETVYSRIGEQNFLLQQENAASASEATVYLKTRSAEEIQGLYTRLPQLLRQNYPGAVCEMKASKNLFQQLFGSRKAALSAQVSSRSGREIPEESRLPEIKDLFGELSDSEIPVRQTAFIEILQENVLLYEVDYQELLEELKNVCNQNFVDNLRAAQRLIPIKLAYHAQHFEQQIKRAFVRNRKNELIPVRELIRIHPTVQYKTIAADRGGEFLSFALAGETPGTAVLQRIQTVFQRHGLYNVRFDGSYFELQQLKTELLIVMSVALLLLYFIMAAQFESLWQPLIILLEIPIDLGGALLFLWWFGGSINIMAAIGMVVMSGVIINDSILKLHTINLLRKQGLGLKEAIRLGGKKRIKPILMTSLTTILALLPFLFMDGLGATLQRPLALTVIGGMIIGTFISLYFIPILYYSFSKKQVP
jgi:multidrug efflux pump subunit AcrB